MSSDWKVYLLLIVACLCIQGFFAMMEMACLSFNKVRLQYYVSHRHRRALWISRMLNAPGVLFGTTLIGINTALQIGSECARRFYESIGLSPDLAPITQVIIVLIFAEIAPLFAGRRYAEHAALIGIPLLYCFSLLLRPFVWLLDLTCKLVHKIMGAREGAGMHLSRDELQKIFEEQEEEFNVIVKNIFSLKAKTAKEFMLPLQTIQLVPSLCTVSEMRSLLTNHYSPFVPIYHKIPYNIVAIAYPRDLLRQAESRRVRDYAKPPWFITESDSIIDILKQFRKNNQSIAVVLNQRGLATGFLTLDAIIDAIFGQVDHWPSIEGLGNATHVVIDRTFPGDTLVESFNHEYGCRLHGEDGETLSQLFIRKLGHLPAFGESIRLERFEFTAEEISLRSVKSIAIKTVHK